MQGAIAAPIAEVLEVQELVASLRAGVVRVPTFQRPLRWEWDDVRKLFDSILRGFPIGSVLLWVRDAPAERVRLGSFEVQAAAMSDARYVVDGQQRLTSLVAALTDPNVPGLEDTRFALAYDFAKGRLVRPAANEPLQMPLPELFDPTRLLSRAHDTPVLKPYLDDAYRLNTTIRQYKVPASVVGSADEEALREIFDRMNNAGKRLSRAEVFHALHAGRSATPGAGQRYSAEDLADSLSTRLSFGRLDGNTILHALLARRGPDVQRDIHVEFSDPMRGDFPGEGAEAAYRGAEEALERAIAFLQKDARVPHRALLAYAYLLVVLTRFFAHFPKPHPRNIERLRRWFWRAAVAGPAAARGAYTSAMRQLAACVQPGDEDGSVTRLLRALEGAPRQLALAERYSAMTAEVRFALCAMFTRAPRALDGRVIDERRLADALAEATTPTPALGTLTSRGRGRVANRFFLVDGELREARAWLLEGDEETLRSHLISAEVCAALASGRDDDAFRLRHDEILALTRTFIAGMMEEEFEDTPPLSSLDLDDPLENEADDGAVLAGTA